MTKKKSKPVRIATYNIGTKTFRIRETILREIQKQRRSTKFCIPQLPFSRLIREILSQYGDFKVQANTLEALQEASEIYLTMLFEDANRCAAHAKRITVQPVDIALALLLRGANM